ncbi:Retrotransposon gag protein [Arachis hypogaea]|nr:Retrotransposon gag protein [Arachis hypogaea]
MVDRSMKHAHRVVENVLVKVGKFFLQADFVILDMKEDENASIILGRKLLKAFRQEQKRRRTTKEATGRTKEGTMQKEVQREFVDVIISTSSYLSEYNLSCRDQNQAVLVALKSQLSELSNDIMGCDPRPLHALHAPKYPLKVLHEGVGRPHMPSHSFHAQNMSKTPPKYTSTCHVTLQTPSKHGVPHPPHLCMRCHTCLATFTLQVFLSSPTWDVPHGKSSSHHQRGVSSMPSFFSMRRRCTLSHWPAAPAPSPTSTLHATFMNIARWAIR